MSACLAVLGHASAAQTIADFQPRWERIGIPIIGCVPAGESWPGAQVHSVISAGENVHAHGVCNRFLMTCRELLKTDFQAFAIIEYDTVNLLDSFPQFNASAISCGLMETYQGDYEGPQPPEKNYVIAMSPWVMTRAMLAAAIEAMDWMLKHPKHEAWISGLLDRWLGVAIKTWHLPIVALRNTNPWADLISPFKPLENGDRLNIVHGWKRKEQFRYLWPK